MAFDDKLACFDFTADGHPSTAIYGPIEVTRFLYAAREEMDGFLFDDAKELQPGDIDGRLRKPPPQCAIH